MNIGAIIVATVVVAAVGLFIGIFLGVAVRNSRWRQTSGDRGQRSSSREQLRRLRYPGCDGLAAAIAKGEAPVNGCPVGGDPVGKIIAGIMGQEAVETVRRTAFVKCTGNL